MAACQVNGFIRCTRLDRVLVAHYSAVGGYRGIIVHVAGDIVGAGPEVRVGAGGVVGQGEGAPGVERTTGGHGLSGGVEGSGGDGIGHVHLERDERVGFGQADGGERQYCPDCILFGLGSHFLVFL